MATTKLTGLSDLTIKALEESLTDLITAVTASTLTLDGDAMENLLALETVMAAMPDRRHHPYASLHSAGRRLRKLAAVATQEERVEQTIVQKEATSGQTTEAGIVRDSVVIDPQALFLVGMHFQNMFEERRDAQNRPAGFKCKVCGAVLPMGDRQAHHEQHRKDKANLATTQIKERFSMAAAKPKTDTPAKQGFPAVYLNEDGSKFSPPGADAVAKSDLIHAFHGWDKPNALHTFTSEEAAKLLSARGWNGFAIKAKEAREAKEARAAAKAADKATAVKAKAEAKKAKASKAKAAPADTDGKTVEDVEVKADPKPTSRARTPRGRKIGS